MKTPTIKKMSIALATALLVSASPAYAFASESSPSDFIQEDVLEEFSDDYNQIEQLPSDFGSVSSDFNADFQLDNATKPVGPRALYDPEWAKKFRPAETDPRYKGSWAEEYRTYEYYATDWADLGPYCLDDCMIIQCLYYGFMRGMSDTYFGKNEYLTRAQMVQVLYNMKDLFDEPVNDTYNPKFKDVPEDAWYTKAVSWAANTGVTSGISADEFGPDRVVTVQEVCVFFDRFFDLQGESDVKFKWTEKHLYPPTQADAWAADSVYRCRFGAGGGFDEDEYYLNEVGSHHNIKGPASRRDVAIMGYKLGSQRMSTRPYHLR